MMSSRPGRRRDDRVLRVATGREGVRRRVVDDVDLRHRQAVGDREVLDDRGTAAGCRPSGSRCAPLSASVSARRREVLEDRVDRARSTNVTIAIVQSPPISQATARPRPPMISRKSRMMKTVLRLFFAIAEYMRAIHAGRCAAARLLDQRSRSELHARRLGDRGGVVDLEELALREAEAAHEQRVREDLDLGVELAHAAVVEAARGLDLVFGVDQLGLQLQEVLVGLQLRVRLGDREDRSSAPTACGSRPRRPRPASCALSGLGAGLR